MTRINKGLADHVAGRTVSAIVDIERAKSLLRREMVTGEIKTRSDKNGLLKLSHADVSILAGRGPNFLNGSKHKLSTKVEVELFLDKLHEDFKEQYVQKAAQGGRLVGDVTRAQRADADLLRAELESVRGELEELRERHEKVATHIHVWAHRLRAARAEIRQMRAEITPTVVSFITPSSRSKPSKR